MSSGQVDGQKVIPFFLSLLVYLFTVYLFTNCTIFKNFEMVGGKVNWETGYRGTGSQGTMYLCLKFFKIFERGTMMDELNPTNPVVTLGFVLLVMVAGCFLRFCWLEFWSWRRASKRKRGPGSSDS